MISGVKVGKAKITVTNSNGQSVYCDVSVIPPKPKIGTASICNFTVNSADGIELAWLSKNLTEKRIKYYTVELNMYNAVGDPAYDEITGKSQIKVKYVGPVEIGGDLVIYSLFAYTAVCHKVVIGNITFEYFDETTETVWCGDIAYEVSSHLQ